ncbi:hypothetical protein [Luteolibacter sp. AS25]|uniref:hypothetical protein n=1 Tax=Luteolibacter sp. AS25 TaxID=3135776 RepID=UPI00398B7894
MHTRFILSCVFTAAISLPLAGCFSSSKVNTKNEASVGQQLTDLDMAYRQGIISEKEYVRLKKALIKRND